VWSGGSWQAVIRLAVNMDDADCTRMQYGYTTCEAEYCVWNVKDLKGKVQCYSLSQASPRSRKQSRELLHVSRHAPYACMHPHLLKYSGDAPQEYFDTRLIVSVGAWAIPVQSMDSSLRNMTYSQSAMIYPGPAPTYYETGVCATFHLHAITHLPRILAVAPSAHLIGIV